MTAEHILDAVGLLDDDLLREAESYPARERRLNRRRWLAWAACFAVVILLGYGAARLGNSDMTAGADNGTVQQNGPEPGAAGGSPPPAEGASTGEPAPNGADGTLTIRVERGGESCSFRCRPGESRTVTALPDGCVSLGGLERQGGGGGPCTDSDAYLGCQVWFSEATAALYLELPEGGYLVFDRINPCEISP